MVMFLLNFELNFGNKMKYTEKNSDIMHEIGHFIMYTLYLSSKKDFNKDLFTSKVLELSIVEEEDKDGICGGYLAIGEKVTKIKDDLCRFYILLSGVLFSLYLIEYEWKHKYEFSETCEIRRYLLDVFYDHGGGEDIHTLLNFKNTGSFKITVYIQELKKIIFSLKNNKSIRKIIHQLYRELQKNKFIKNERLFSIIKPHIPELKKLGKQIYNLPNKIKLRAKTLLF